MDVKEPISLVERLARRSAPTVEAAPPSPSPELPSEDVAEGYQAFKLGGDHRFEVMVTFRFRNGNMRSLGYSFLVGLDFNPSRSLVMEFSGGQTVTLTGRNLTPLFKALAAHKVMSVWEVDPLAEPAEDAATVVNAIDFGNG